MPYSEITESIAREIEARGYRGVGCNRFYGPKIGLVYALVEPITPKQASVTLLQQDMFVDSFMVRARR